MNVEVMYMWFLAVHETERMWQGIADKLRR